MLVQTILKWLPQKLITLVVNIISQMLCYRKIQDLNRIQYIKFPIIILPIFLYLRNLFMEVLELGYIFIFLTAYVPADHGQNTDCIS